MKWRKIIIVCLVVLELVTAGFLARALHHNLVLKFDATHYAGASGFLEAEHDYRKGIRRVFEVVIIDSSAHDYSGPAYGVYDTRPANRKDGPFEVWQIIQSPSMPQSHRTVLDEYARNYNRAMRVRLEHPESYTPDGERIPRQPAKANQPPRRNVL